MDTGLQILKTDLQLQHKLFIMLRLRDHGKQVIKTDTVEHNIRKHTYRSFDGTLTLRFLKPDTSLHQL